VGASTLFFSTGLVFFLIAGYRGLLRRRRSKPTEIPLIVSTVSLALAFIFLAPAAQVLESGFVPSLGRLLSNVCTLIAAFEWLHVMLYIAYTAEQVPARVKARLITLLIAIIVMVATFFASRPPTGVGVFTGLYRSQPTLTVYTLVFTGYLGFTVVDLGMLALCSIRGARAWLRLGMVFIAAGCLIATGYLIEKVIGIISELVTGSTAESYCSSTFATLGCAVAIAMPALAALLMVFGTTLPALGPRLEDLIRGCWYCLRRLQPLWATLHEALPDIAASPDREHVPLPLSGISERLYRRVIEIRDGLLVLQPYRDSTDTDKHRKQAKALGVADRHRAAAIEAADIRAALHRRRQQVPPCRYTAEDNVATHQGTFTSELRWLAQVSNALARDEIGRTSS
jgi:Family of unknown function (DUF6545)